jgi:hypothetical protein
VLGTTGLSINASNLFLEAGDGKIDTDALVLETEAFNILSFGPNAEAAFLLSASVTALLDNNAVELETGEEETTSENDSNVNFVALGNNFAGNDEEGEDEEEVGDGGVLNTESDIWSDEVYI